MLQHQIKLGVTAKFSRNSFPFKKTQEQNTGPIEANKYKAMAMEKSSLIIVVKDSSQSLLFARNLTQN